MAILMDNRSFIERILPAQPCVLCGALSHFGVWCKACGADLPRLKENHCPVCALPSANRMVCGKCLQYPPDFDRTVAVFVYAFPVDKLVQAVKFSGQLVLVNYLADALAERISVLPDGLIAMPLHPARLRERGYNQSQLLAQRLAKRLSIPLLANACERVRNTSPQSALPWREREKNMLHAFECSADLSGKHIAIADDVMTTGATIAALASAIKRAGAREVSAWAVARTLPH